jgi:hypothetical protein
MSTVITKIEISMTKIQVGTQIKTVKVNVGPPGAKGDPGITVSSTPPENPELYHLWFEIP